LADSSDSWGGLTPPIPLTADLSPSRGGLDQHKRPTNLVSAIARELSAFIWAISREVMAASTVMHN